MVRSRWEEAQGKDLHRKQGTFSQGLNMGDFETTTLEVFVYMCLDEYNSR